MATVEASLDVNVPVQVAYNQWTQFEEFPQFMEGVESVTQLDDTHLRWVAEIGGEREEWEAEITEQTPDQRVAWRSTSGNQQGGSVDFHRIDDSTTRVSVTMDWEPEGAKQSLGAAVGADKRKVEGDLERFKEFVESRGTETGAWRGEVVQENVRQGA